MPNLLLLTRSNAPAARLVAILVSAALLSAPPVARTAESPVFDSHDQEMLYFWGTTFGQQLEAIPVTDAKDVEWIVRGLRDRAAHTAPAFGDEYPSLLNNYLVQRTRDAAQAEAAASSLYVKAMGKERRARTTTSGLVYLELSRGSGARPDSDSVVTVHYVGSLRDGRVFDSSRERGSPLKTRLTAVIPCWTEALQMMRVGGRAKITCPPELAYGDRANARIPAGSALTFDVELLEVSR